MGLHISQCPNCSDEFCSQKMLTLNFSIFIITNWCFDINATSTLLHLLSVRLNRGDFACDAAAVPATSVSLSRQKENSVIRFMQIGKVKSPPGLPTENSSWRGHIASRRVPSFVVLKRRVAPWPALALIRHACQPSRYAHPVSPDANVYDKPLRECTTPRGHIYESANESPRARGGT